MIEFLIVSSFSLEGALKGDIGFSSILVWDLEDRSAFLEIGFDSLIRLDIVYFSFSCLFYSLMVVDFHLIFFLDFEVSDADWDSSARMLSIH